MNRIFPVLAAFGLALMLATFVLGMSLGDVRDPSDQTTQQWATVHRLSGIASAILILLVNGIVMTYFVGTTRWCKEVATAYSLDPALFAKGRATKQRSFPLSLVNMLIVVGIVALGGAADPAAALQIEPPAGLAWSTVHQLGALLGIAMIALASYFQWLGIVNQVGVIQEMMAKVAEVRRARGLETEPSDSRKV